MTRYAVALGSNLGDRLGYLQQAVDEIRQIGTIVDVSGIYESAPVGGPEQEPYLNAVLVLESDLDPYALLAALQGIETKLGRERSERWGPRTLDLDVVATDGAPVDDLPRLMVPHPRAGERRFVMQPLFEVWPQADLGSGSSLGDSLKLVGDQEVDYLGRAWERPGRRRAGQWWVGGQLVLFAVIGLALIWDGALPQGAWGWPDWVGLLVAGLGLGLILWSASALGPGLTAVPEPVRGAEMVIAGPYRYVRHPMYSGVVLLFLGVAVLVRSVLAVLLVLALAAFFRMKSGYEERQLRIAYPAYRKYRQRVRFRFLPPVV